MHKVYNILGIDLGGCMSGNSAYIYAEITPDNFRVIETIKEPRHKDHISCQNYISDLFERIEVDAIAIDSPLSLPLPLLRPGSKGAEREGAGEIINPYLFRFTDYFLYKQFGLRPMPPAGDRIGRLTARAIALLHRFDYSFPYITIGQKKVPIYEVYPKQIAQELRLSDYKKEPSQLFKAINCSPFQADEHLLDALLAAFAGYHILLGNTLDLPDEAYTEGWCFPLTMGRKAVKPVDTPSR